MLCLASFLHFVILWEGRVQNTRPLLRMMGVNGLVHEADPLDRDLRECGVEFNLSFDTASPQMHSTRLCMKSLFAELTHMFVLHC